MTNEEAIEEVKTAFDIWEWEFSTGDDWSDAHEARDMAIKALEQQPRTGHWIKLEPYPLQMHEYECSECGHETDDNTENYCSECGAKMEVEK